MRVSLGAKLGAKVLGSAMSETNVRRRGFGEDGIYLDAARNRYMGAISLGYGPDRKRIRRKVSGKTKQEVRAKLQALHQELNSGVRSSSTYTVRQAVEDWLREGLDGTASASRLSAYRSESGSFSATRHTPECLSQKADHDRCSARNSATLAAA
jgi:hypothetical protein